MRIRTSFRAVVLVSLIAFVTGCGKSPYEQFLTGLDYETGNAVQQDYAEAAKWHRKAADRGLKIAQDHLGYLYAEGKGVKKDANEAIRWNRIAADQGYGTAQLSLGKSYIDGNGVSKDSITALMWLELSVPKLAVAVNSQQEAISLRDALKTEMSEEEIAEAQRRAAEFKPKTWEEVKAMLE